MHRKRFVSRYPTTYHQSTPLNLAIRFYIIFTVNFFNNSQITHQRNALYFHFINTDTNIHYKSNHPLKQKLSAYIFLLNRLHQLPISQEHKRHEMNNILQIAKHNGYPITMIEKLNKQIINKNNNKTNNTQTTKQSKMGNIRIP
jgi:hypothetical protein